MKKTTLILSALLALSVNAFAQGDVKLPPAATATAKVNALDEVTKERDELKAALAEAKNLLIAADTKAQQDAIVREYFKAVAEKNQTLLELVSAKQQIETLTRRVSELENAATAAAKKPEGKK